MKRPRWSVFEAAALLATASIVATGPVARAAPDGGSGFDVYEGTLDAAQWRRLGLRAEGTTGTCNAVSGPSGGWKGFDADLSAYAGKRVEISISDASDRFAQGFGVFLDDARIDVDGTTVTQASFETDLGGWTVPDPPPGSAPNRTDWISRPDAGSPSPRRGPGPRPAGRRPPPRW